ncbi:MAG: preprotein translocase subunit SecA [Pirellulales bacterium]
MSGSMIERLLASLPCGIRSSLGDEQLLLRIREQGRSLISLPAAELRLTMNELRQLHGQRRSSSAAVLVSAFAAVCEAARRCYGLELFDVQLRAGLAIARGDIAEMQTGEGKTLAAALPAFLRAITERSVHVVTPNGYLARRDFELLEPVYRSLGCTVGLLPEGAPFDEKRQAYSRDITYGTGYEVGFDYLREQLACLGRRPAPLGDRYRDLLRGAVEQAHLGARRAFAIVDEIDSVLIDEAATPLILSDLPHEQTVSAATYEQALRMAVTLVPDQDYLVDPQRSRAIALTEHGRRRCYQALAGDALPHLASPWSDVVQQALQALHGLRRDIDYVVANDKLIVVDSATGRLCPDRAWRNGLQQFLEVKESVPLTPARGAAARITRQRYFSRYKQVSGMTGTAADSAREFRETYGLRVATIPPRLPSRRLMLADRVFADAESRWLAVETEIARLHCTGRPVLVGCRTIEISEHLARRLDRAGIDYQLLNGKQNAAEAEVIAGAGRLGAVTIATNMAGRGTDIKLAAGMAELGGMHLISVERNDSRRVDRQLIGRVGRQGDPGSCQFFLSADDPLLVRFAPEVCQQIKALPQTAGEVGEDYSRQIRAAQERCEAAGYLARKELAAADTWICDELGALLQ